MSRSGKVTVVGSGFYGSTTALRLAEYDIFETVVLTDIVEGKPEGLALDMNQSRSIEGFETKVIGATTTPEGAGYEATANSDVVVITAGLPRKPGMSRMDLIGVTFGIFSAVRTGSLLVAVGGALYSYLAYTTSVTKRTIELLIPIAMTALLFVVSLTLPHAK